MSLLYALLQKVKLVHLLRSFPRVMLGHGTECGQQPSDLKALWT